MSEPRLRYCPLFKPGFAFPPNPSLHQAAQERMEALNGERDLDELIDSTLKDSGFQAAAELRYALELCRKSNVLDYAVYDADSRIAFVRPNSNRFEFGPRAKPAPLSRFASLHRDGSSMILELPLSHAIIELSSPGISLDHPGIEALLAAAGFVESDDESTAPGVFWEFHDLLFHHRSRATPGRRVGATWRFESPAVVKPAMSSRPVPLGIPERASPFQQILDNRRSLRTPGARPIEFHTLAEFLYRSIGTREPMGDDFRHPYPSGGGLHELEYYIAVRDCDGLDPGFYHYHAIEHALYALTIEPADLEALIAQAVTAWGEQFPAPNLLITIAARLPRVAWKYEGMAYRTILLNAGCVLQTMYLVATDMNLAPCAIGNGDPARFANITGLDPLSETSVAEFALSSRE
jgi:oxazoline/thiazoline dehydrogenase